jgi:hypothetical protein
MCQPDEARKLAADNLANSLKRDAGSWYAEALLRECPESRRKPAA